MKLVFLTPAKIALLALIDIYIEGAVPFDAIVPVVRFITSHLAISDAQIKTSVKPDQRWGRVTHSIDLVTSLVPLEKLLAPFVASDRVPGCRLWDRYLDTLWGIDSVHALHDFFARREQFLVQTKAQLRESAKHGEEPPSGMRLSRNSQFGAFFRKCHIEYGRLQFHALSTLWNAFVQYRQPTAAHWRGVRPHHGQLGFDVVLAEACASRPGSGAATLARLAYDHDILDEGEGAEIPVSKDDVGRLLEFQVGQIQKYGSRAPAQIRDQFRELLKHSRIIPNLRNYLEYADVWRSGDHNKAHDLLHRFFDYSMHNRNRPYYQYALMNLAMLQGDFGHYTEAMATMLESVQVARENRDTMCLNVALNWFFHMGRLHPHLIKHLEENKLLGTWRENLAYIRHVSREAGVWVLVTTSLLSEARLRLQYGSNMAATMETLLRTSQIAFEHGVKIMLAPRLIMTIAMWDRLGLSTMSTMLSEVSLICHTADTVFDDEIKTHCRLAGTLAARGRYDEALARVNSLRSRNTLRSLKHGQFWQQYRAQLMLRRELAHDNLDIAQDMLSDLFDFGFEETDPDLAFIIESLHIESLMRRQEYEAALDKIDRLLAEHREHRKDIASRIRLLLMKARLYDVCGRPERAFSITALAFTWARRALLMRHMWQATGALANILTALGEFYAAADLLETVLPRCLETDDWLTAAVLCGHLADARMGQASEAGRIAAEEGAAAVATLRAELLKDAYEMLELALRYYTALEEKKKRREMLAKLATLMRLIGDDTQAEHYAARYLKKDEVASTDPDEDSSSNLAPCLLFPHTRRKTGLDDGVPGSLDSRHNPTSRSPDTTVRDFAEAPRGCAALGEGTLHDSARQSFRQQSARSVLDGKAPHVAVREASERQSASPALGKGIFNHLLQGPVDKRDSTSAWGRGTYDAVAREAAKGLGRGPTPGKGMFDVARRRLAQGQNDGAASDDGSVSDDSSVQHTAKRQSGGPPPTGGSFSVPVREPPEGRSGDFTPGEASADAPVGEALGRRTAGPATRGNSSALGAPRGKGLVDDAVRAPTSQDATSGNPRGQAMTPDTDEDLSTAFQMVSCFPGSEGSSPLPRRRQT
ncbi:hypothetical protein QBC46DRAFT_306265 [Diplogelasinospora grovesii]|uniref:Anaphase-promoting complex subunit 5 n=1 Tax=Diplogelasinospora grovesii TaxID=303347 RepID=A0AAN6NDZ4_9PEZI|nr:hypothetical protein QBC46DRAFT_306265 [Diplogelasinospora grovesii]